MRFLSCVSEFAVSQLFEGIVIVYETSRESLEPEQAQGGTFQ